MYETIGTAAGQVWATLSTQKDPLPVSELPKAAKLKTQIAYQALGWLAREGKVQYHEQKGGKLAVSLAPAECYC